MSAATVLFLLLRVAHVLLAAVWLGAMVFVTFLLMPALQETGPAAGPFLAALTRRKIAAFMGALGGITVLTGIYLYWRFTGHFDPALSATRAAMVFGTGGISGILSVIIGGAVVGRNAARMESLGKAMALPEGPERAVLMAQSAAAQDRAIAGARIVLVLQIIALGGMAVGHYV